MRAAANILPPTSPLVGEQALFDLRYGQEQRLNYLSFFPPQPASAPSPSPLRRDEPSVDAITHKRVCGCLSRQIFIPGSQLIESVARHLRQRESGSKQLRCNCQSISMQLRLKSASNKLTHLPVACQRANKSVSQSISQRASHSAQRVVSEVLF